MKYYGCRRVVVIPPVVDEIRFERVRTRRFARPKWTPEIQYVHSGDIVSGEIDTDTELQAPEFLRADEE